MFPSIRLTPARALVALLSIVGGILFTTSAPVLAADDGKLAQGLTDAMRLDGSKQHRAADSGAAIQAYIAAGYLARKPNGGADYTDYWWLKKPAPFMGHELVMISEQYMSRWIGCCVDPGLDVAVRIHGSTVRLEQFARENKCSIDTNADLREPAKDSKIAITSLRAGRYEMLSCHERDIQQP
ncbi:hypothetical protein OKW45_004885 [Paraburkholderia sp. WSM4175]|uniref:hypothetical protein n=1 Tax=Paraburkholderia sp. WSM4175 TaxID=2991072 RepID=UPI003D232AC5